MGEDDYSWLTDFFNQQGQYDPRLDPGSGTEDTNIQPGGSTSPISTDPSTGGSGINLPPNVASQILKALGLGSSGSDPNMLGILGLLAPIISGVMTSNAARSATNQQSDAVKQANALIGNYMTDTNARYAPYATGGQAAFNRAGAIASGYTPLAPRFPALGTPAAGAAPLGAIFNRGR